jgi:hypothetical protein
MVMKSMKETEIGQKLRQTQKPPTTQSAFGGQPFPAAPGVAAMRYTGKTT